MRIYKEDLENITEDGIAKLIKQFKQDPLSLINMNDQEKKEISSRIQKDMGDYLNNSGAEKYIIGLSGGIDSALAATEAVKAVGSDRVLGVLIPSRNTSPDNIQDATNLANKLGIEYLVFDPELFEQAIEIDIAACDIPTDNSYASQVRTGNLHARQRMKWLRDTAWANNGIVLGTTNWTEQLLGYFTIAGDGTGGVDVEYLLELYKTMVWDLAKHEGVALKIIHKKPSAELWQGQTDEDELGAPYRIIDQVIVAYEINQAIDSKNLDPKLKITPKQIAESLTGDRVLVDYLELQATKAVDNDKKRFDRERLGAYKQQVVERILSHIDRVKHKLKPIPFTDLRGEY